MRILVTGAGGLVGSALVPQLAAGGHEILRLKRSQGSPPDPSEPRNGSLSLIWDPAVGLLDPRPLENLDAVVHLAGENIAAGRWTPEFKDRIRRSRVLGTRLLSERLAALTHKPAVLICASATGFYADRGDEVIEENGAPSDRFLSLLAQAWEEAAAPARAAGIRVVHLRTGVVLSLRGGALPRLMTPFRLGLGARLGNGRQYFSWISLEDLVRTIVWVFADPSLQGPVNATAPNPVTNAEFTRILARVLHRPALFAVPAWALRLALGEMAEEMLLSGARVHPARLLASGFSFDSPTLESALRHLLGERVAVRDLPLGYGGHDALDRRLTALLGRGGCCETIGTSREGRPIQAYRWGSRTASSVLVVSLLHPMEWIGLQTHLALLETRLGRSGFADLLSIPVANPDGFARVEESLRSGRRRWVRGNAAGVDLNRNFPVGHRARPPSFAWWPFYRPGPAGLSEPETAAIARWIDGQTVGHALSLHSFGRRVFVPPSRTPRPLPDTPALLKIARAASRGSGYRAGVLGRWSTFFRARGTELDYFHEVAGARSFLIEISAGGLGRWGWRDLGQPFCLFNPPHPEEEIRRVLPVLDRLVVPAS